MEAYSLDLRQRICAACDEGLDTRQEVAERFGVGRWFVQKLLRQRRGDGTIAAKARGRGPAPAIGAAGLQLLRKLVKSDPDATLAELCSSLRQAGGPAVGVWTMCRARFGPAKFWTPTAFTRTTCRTWRGLLLALTRAGPAATRTRATTLESLSPGGA